MNLFELEGESVPDSLIAGNKKGMLTRGCLLAPGQGILKRGTLLAKNEDGTWVMYGDTGADDVPGTGVDAETDSGTETAVAAVETVTLPSGILTDDADTGTDTEGDAVIAEEYITGTFNPDAVIVREGTSVRDLTETLRKLGIFLEEVE